MVKHVDSLDAEGTDQMPKLGVDAVEPLVQAQVGNHGASRAGQVLGSRRYVLADDRNEVQCFDLISELCPAGWHFSLAQGVVAPAEFPKAKLDVSLDSILEQQKFRCSCYSNNKI